MTDGNIGSALCWVFTLSGHAPSTFFLSQRDQTAGTANAGGYLVGAASLPGDVFADALRASSVMLALGVQQMPLGPGNQSIPRGGDATAVWLSSESATFTKSDVTTYGAVALTPRHVGAYLQASRNWMKATTQAAQDFVVRSLGAVVAAGVDKALIAGSGSSGEPQGLINATGVGTASGATMTWTKAITCINTVETANGIKNANTTGWAVAPDAALILRGRERATGSGFILDAGRIDNRPAVVSASVPAGTAIYGDSSQILLGTYGVLEIGTDPYGVSSALFKTGLVGIRAIYSCDAGVLRGESFSKLTSIS